MRDELYINGEKADMPSSGVNLTYKSNLLADLNKIVGNYSQTIKLPRTANNMRLIGGAILPSSGSRFPYINHAGQLYRDGALIVDRANVVLLSVGEYIQVSLTWGSISAIQSFVEYDATLADLGWNDEVDYIVAGGVAGEAPSTPHIDWGVSLGEHPELTYAHPVVRVDDLIERIKRKFGIEISVTNELLPLVVPLTAQNVSEKNQEDSIVDISSNEFIQENAFFNVVIDDINNSYYYTSTDDFIGSVVRISAKVKKLKVRADYNITCVVTSFNDAEYLQQNLTCAIMGVNVYPTIVNSNPNIQYGYYVRFQGTTKEIELDIDVPLPFASISQATIIGVLTNEQAGFNASFRLFPKIEDLRRGQNYYFSVNMPSVKVTDLIKAIKAMHGCYYKAEGNTILLEHYSEIYNRRDDALDWSELLVTGVSFPETMSYTIDGLAQNNEFKYKEDETTIGNYDSLIHVNDLTLEYSTDMYNSPFAASDESEMSSVNSYSQIPIYTIEEKDEEVEVKFKDVKPRILLREKNRFFYTTFKGLDWDTLIANYYNEYKQLITDAKVISERVKLTPIELQQLDMYTPIYLKQYGAYFAILEIKTKNDNINEVKLLKI